MRTPADIAIDNVLAFDVKKDGLTQRQNGDWVIRLTVAQLDMHQVIVNANMGTIFQCTLVEKNDDGTAVDHKAIERDKWTALGAVKQAGIRCKDPVFQAFLREHYEETIVDEEGAAMVVRTECCVLTRGDLGKPGFSDNRLLWFNIDNKFQAWKARERA